MVFVGVDWAEAHHDVCVVDHEGAVLARRRIVEGIEGLAGLHGLLAEHAEEPDEVIVGIETDRGLLVSSLVAAGYEIYAINPLAVARYRDRHGISGASPTRATPSSSPTSCAPTGTTTGRSQETPSSPRRSRSSPGRTRVHLGPSAPGERAAQRAAGVLPGRLVAFGTHLEHNDALAVLAIAPTASLGRQAPVSKIASALRRGGRKRGVEKRSQQITRCCGLSISRHR